MKSNKFGILLFLNFAIALSMLFFVCNENFRGDLPPKWYDNLEYGGKYSGDFCYKDIKGKITILRYKGSDETVIIPAEIAGKPVTVIGIHAFRALKLTNVEIPASVTTIEQYAFAYNELVDVIIPDSVTSMGSYAFCKNKLTEVVISESITVIEEEIFRDNKLTSLIIPNNVIKIEKRAFMDNKLMEITISDNVSVYSNAFWDKSYEFSKYDMYPNSFYECYEIFHDKAPGTYIYDKNNNFWTKQYKYSGGFGYDEKNSEIRIFCYKGNDAIVSIPEKIEGKPVTAIGMNTFRDLKIKGVEIPNSVTSIRSCAFRNNELTDIIIPASVISIGKYAFSDNELIALTIPNSVTFIGNDAFACNRLVYLFIPDSITVIETGVFWRNNLTSLIIPSWIKEIKRFAFQYNNLTAITVPKTSIAIDDRAFLDNPNNFRYLFEDWDAEGFKYCYNINKKKSGTYIFDKKYYIWTKQ